MAEGTGAAPAGQDNSAKLYVDQVIVCEKLCEMVAIPAGARVLDIGCGPGHSVLNAALAAGRRRAKVTAFHVKEPVLERARARAEMEAIEGIEFIHGDPTALPFADGSFDYVLSTLGMVFLPDQEGAAKEMARVLRPGGTIALTAYTRQSLPSQVYDLTGTIFPNAPRSERHHYHWSDGARAGELLNPYFHSVQLRMDSYDSCFESAAVAFDATSRWNPNLQRMLSLSTAEQIEQLRSSFISIADQTNRATDGTYMGKMDYAVITGVRADR